MADQPPLLTIELTRTDATLRIEGVVIGGSGEVQANMTISHEGQGGRMNTTQGRTITLLADERITVAVTQINFGPDSNLTVDLSLEADGSVLSRSRTQMISQ